MEKMSKAAVLRKYFFRDGTDTLKSFMDEIKALNAAEKDELARLAAAELGVELQDVAA